MTLSSTLTNVLPYARQIMVVNRGWQWPGYWMTKKINVTVKMKQVSIQGDKTTNFAKFGVRLAVEIASSMQRGKEEGN